MVEMLLGCVTLRISSDLHNIKSTGAQEDDEHWGAIRHKARRQGLADGGIWLSLPPAES